MNIKFTKVEQTTYLLLIRLDKSSNDSKRGKPQVLKWPEIIS